MCKPILLLAAAAIALIAASCSTDDGQQRRAVIERLDIAIADSLSAPGFAERYRPALDAITLSQGLDPQSPVAVAHYISDRPYFKIFRPDVERVLPDLSATDARLSRTFTNLSRQIDSIALPARIFGYVSPYNQMVVQVDTVMLIALNHYLGADYPGYSGFDLYLRNNKRPERLVYDVTEAVLSSNFPPDESNYSTALQSMLYQGATVYTMMKTVDRAELADALGWTPEQLRWAQENEENIWRRMAADGLLFTTSKIDIAKLVNPSPATAIVHPDAPGRLGRYVGYRIVESYVDRHPDTPLARLFTDGFLTSENVLRESGYAPGL